MYFLVVSVYAAMDCVSCVYHSIDEQKQYCLRTAGTIIHINNTRKRYENKDMNAEKTPTDKKTTSSQNDSCRELQRHGLYDTNYRNVMNQGSFFSSRLFLDKTLIFSLYKS